MTPVEGAALEMEGRVVVLAGPGVVDDGAVNGLRAFAAAGNLGVANTWGAKGVFAWDSPHHLGTCGLQARDFELLGFATVDAIIATGLDAGESPRERFALAPVVEVAPAELGALAGRVRATGDPLPNELYVRLAAVAQPGYTDAKVPLHPARAVADLGAVLPDGGFVTAEPGPAALWVARVFPTPALVPGRPRRVHVPSRRVRGAAARLARDAARAGRASVLVTAAPLDDASAAVVADSGDGTGSLTVVQWGADGDLASVDAHRERLADAIAAAGVTDLNVPVALEDTALLLEAAGKVVAWGGLA
jgi:hypothetical protein